MKTMTSAVRTLLIPTTLALSLLALQGCGSSTPETPVVTVAPLTATVQAGGGSQQFTATVSNANTTAVVWKVNGAVGGGADSGTITQAGMYAAPATVPSGAVTVTAVSVANATSSGSATVTLTAAITVAVTPATATVAPSGTVQFAATVSNANSNSGVTWSVNGTAGGNSANGTISATGLYTAPSVFPGANQVTITATSVQDTSKSGQAMVTITQPVTVAVTPAAVTVNLGATQDFAATVSGTSNAAVTWSVNGTKGGSVNVGTIDANGTFTAPTILPTDPVETVTATSGADATASGSAKVTLQTPPSAFTLTPASVSLTVQKAGTVAQAFQLAVSPGFTNPVQFTVAGAPINVTSTLDNTTLTGSGTVNLTLAAGSISLANAAVPVTLTATSTDATGKAMVQTATVLLTVGGWAGHVRTVAGGPGGVGFQDGSGTADELDATAITNDGGQNLYFTDSRGSALRSYGLVNQQITTLDGGPYNFTYPNGQGMVYDSSNQTAYVADGERNQILAFPVNGYTVTVVAGAGPAGYADGVGTAAQFDYPHGLAISADHSTLYVADTDNEVVRAVDIGSGTVTTLAGQHGVYRSSDGVGGAASFCQPTGLDIDPAGANLYVSDECGYVIRSIAIASATVRTVAGSGAVGFSDGAAAAASFFDLNGVTVDPHAGTPLVYVADGNQIRAVSLGTSPVVYTLAGNPSAGQSDGSGAQAGFYAPDTMTALANSVGAGTTTLFVADDLNGLLRRIDFTNPATATASSNAAVTVTTLAGQPSHRGNSDGAGTGANYGSASVAEFSQPEGIVTDGKIAYVADSINGAIREIDLSTSTVTTVAGPHQGYGDGPAGAAAFYKPAGVAWVPSQNLLYIADTGNGAIRELNLTTQTVSTIAGTNASGYADGSLTAARFNNPFGILASPDGTKLYIADTGNNAIRLIDLTAGTVTTIAGNGGLGSNDGIGTAARFAEPAGLAFDSSGNILYISDFENHAIRQLNLTTLAVTTLVGAAHKCGATDGPASSATLCTPALIASDGRSIFWGDSDTGLLRVINLSTGVVATLAGDPNRSGLMHMEDGDMTETSGELVGPVRYNGVFGVAEAPDGSFVLFTDKTANVVRIVY